MRTLGWILTVFGGFLLMGLLISMTQPDFYMNGPMVLTIVTILIIFGAGIAILKKKKK